MEKTLHCLNTLLPEITWPAFPSPKANAILATLFQLEKSQGLPLAWHREKQLRQASRLITYASLTVPFYKERLKPFTYGNQLTWSQWNDIPVLTRKEVQTAGNALMTQNLPPEHAELTAISTSGSTGMPVTCYTTRVTRFMYMVDLCWEHVWHQRDLAGTHMAIRPSGKLDPGRIKHEKQWGGGIFDSGKSLLLDVHTNLDRQLALLQQVNPMYLLSLPSNLKALAKLFHDQGMTLSSLREVRSYGEVFPEQARKFCADTWMVKFSDIYSAQEIGAMAFECPEEGNLHSLTHNNILEVLKEDGTPCHPGETGQVVVTTLLNYGYPLIRYALGDYAQVDEPCRCGRPTPVLKRVLGRQRNMLVLPDGGKIWPLLGAWEWARDMPVSQFQFVQKSKDRIEARLVADRPLTDAEENRLVTALHQRFTYPFKFEFCYVDNIPRSKSGKYEDFMSEL